MKTKEARSLANRMVRAHRSHGMPLATLDLESCIYAMTTRYLSPSVRKKLGEMWSRYQDEVERREVG